MKALILAAGYATRLYPLTKEYPKPLLKVGERPIIDFILDKLSVLDGVEEVIVVTNNKFISKFREWAAEVKFEKRITLVDDLTRNLDDRLGAIGDLDFVISNKRIKDDLLVIGGDNLFDGDMRDFVSFAEKHRSNPVIGVYKLKNKKEARNYGVIRLDTARKVVDFQEKPEKPSTNLVAMCLYFFPKGKIGLTKEYLDSKDNKRDATGFYIDWLRKKLSVYGFVFSGRWFDIGRHSFYNQAQKSFK